MPNFEQEDQKPFDAQQSKPNQQVEDERFQQSIDADHLYDTAIHFQDYFDWREKSTGDPFAKVKADEFYAVTSNLSKFQSRTDMNGADLIRFLNNEMNSLQKNIGLVADEKMKAHQKRINRLRSTIQFVTEKIMNPVTPEQLEKMNQDLTQEQSKTQIANKQESAPLETRTPTQPVQPERQTGQTEAERVEAQLLTEIAKIGGVAINTSIPPEYTQGHGSGGFTTLTDSKVQVTDHKFAGEVVGVFSSDNGEYIQHQMKEAGVHEAIALRPVIQHSESVENITVEKPGFFGRKKVTEQKRVFSSRQPKHNEMVKDGNEEEAYALSYLVCGGEEYRDYSNRSGQMLATKIILPKSTAEKVYTQIQKDPSFAQRIADQIVTTQANLDEKVWFNGSESTHGQPVRPPYEQWHQMSERKMLFSQEVNNNASVSNKKLQIENVKAY